MNKQLRNKWIKALLGKKYVQIQGALGNIDKGRCCLGVLCDLEKIKFQPIKSRMSEGSKNREAYMEINELITLSNRDELTTQNDIGISFKEIAKWIKENL